MNKLMKNVPLFASVAILFCSTLLAPLGGGAASAADFDPPDSIDETNVLDDLDGSVLNGEKFDIDDWGFNERRDPEIVSFMEFGYSIYANRQDDYGLYVYIYNPQGVALDTATDRNKIQLKAGECSTEKYPLVFLNYSDRAGTEGMFYKFKVQLSAGEKTSFLNNLVQASRKYKITEFEISVRGAVTSYTCATTYTYSGYAQGYGSELQTESTLACKTDGFEDYAELNVHQTVYRPEGDYHEGKQSQLNSCYFRVPAKYFENYGALTSIVAEWYEYVTKPILVTENVDMYRFFNNLNGEDVPSANDGIGYANFHIIETDTALWGLIKRYQGLISTNCEEVESGYTVGFLGLGGHFDLGSVSENYTRDPSNPYSAVFWTGGDSYKNFSATAQQVETQLRNMSKNLGGPYLGGFYSESLFSDDIHSGRKRGYNHIELSADDSLSLFTQTTVKNAWQNFAGGYELNTEYQSVNAIEEVEESDLQGSDEAISKLLFVDRNDVADLKLEFQKAQSAGEHLILFHYADSEYYSIPFYSSIHETKGKEQSEIDNMLFEDLQWKMYHKEEYNGFIAQQTVYLDFDIISLKYTKDGVVTEIPVAMAPQNVFSSVTPPLEEDFHTASGIPWYIWIAIVLALVVLVIALVLLFPVIRPVISGLFKVIWWIVSAPFRLIAWIIKKSAAAAKKRREEKKASAKAEAAKPKPATKAATKKPKAAATKKPSGSKKNKTVKK